MSQLSLQKIEPYVESRKAVRKIISFMHISLDGFVAGPNGEIRWIKVGEEIFTMSVGG